MTRMASPCPTPPTLRARKVRCVWTSITGKRARSTRVSGTWSMLRGSKSGSASGTGGRRLRRRLTLERLRLAGQGRRARGRTRNSVSTTHDETATTSS